MSLHFLIIFNSRHNVLCPTDNIDSDHIFHTTDHLLELAKNGQTSAPKKTKSQNLLDDLEEAPKIKQYKHSESQSLRVTQFQVLQVAAGRPLFGPSADHFGRKLQSLKV